MMASNAPLWCSSLNSNQILKLALRVKQSSSTSRRSGETVAPASFNGFPDDFCFVKMGAEQSNAGIPVVIKPVPKSEKIVGVGNMTNILEGLGRIIVRGARGVEGFSAADKDLGILDPAEPSRLHHLMAHFFPSSFLPHPHSSFISSTSWNSNSKMFHHLPTFSPSWFFFHFLIHMNPPCKTLNPLCKTFKGKISLGNECPFVDVKFSLNVWKMFAPTKLIWEPHSNKNSRHMYI